MLRSLQPNSSTPRRMVFVSQCRLWCFGHLVWRNFLPFSPETCSQFTRASSPTPRRYYAAEAQVSQADVRPTWVAFSQALTKELGNLLTAGVQDRLVSDVPVGTLCSGGHRLEPDHRDLRARAQGRPRLQRLGARRYARTRRESCTPSVSPKASAFICFPAAANGEMFRDNLVRAIYHSDHPADPSQFRLLPEDLRVGAQPWCDRLAFGRGRR